MYTKKRERAAYKKYVQQQRIEKLSKQPANQFPSSDKREQNYRSNENIKYIISKWIHSLYK